jgi:hypothetical protein
MRASTSGSGRAARSHRFRSLTVAALAASWSAGCDAERRAEAVLTTRVEALTPAPRPELAATPTDLAPDISELAPRRCPEVARQASELSATLPRELDPDTLATGVTADGCDLTIEYQLVTLDAKDVTEQGLRAMRGSVQGELCADRGALAVMQQGGRFTNIYYDRARARIGLFSVAADDCGI